MTPPLKLYNTLTHQKNLFQPLRPEHVRLYVCGPTVYDKAHLGNARPYVVFDVLYRILKSLYPKVTYARNITDIDDKIIERAHTLNISISDLTEDTTQRFQKDMKALQILPPDVEPRATHFIPHMIDLIKKLIEKEYAYVAEGHVLFQVKRYSSYGHLSRRSLDTMRAGSRIDIAPYKKDPWDFILWKPSPKASHIPGWESPWGWGRPGWHIECSAMSQHLLDTPFDIHGGGQDLIFPHHENEIAQTCAAHDIDCLAQVWMHNGIVTINGQKMAKSLGNFLTLSDILGQYPGEVVRWVLLSTHYRQPLDWKSEACVQALQALDRLYIALRTLTTEETAAPDPIFQQALYDDINTPLALARLQTLATKANQAPCKSKQQSILKTLQTCGQSIGFFQMQSQTWLQHPWREFSLTFQEIEDRISQRHQARIEKNYHLADRLRDDLFKEGILLEDQEDQTIWRRSCEF